jgi:hypothetical protein
MVFLSGSLFLVRFRVLHFQGGMVALRFVMISANYSVHGRGHRMLNSDGKQIETDEIQTNSRVVEVQRAM